MRKAVEFHERFEDIRKAASYVGSGLVDMPPETIIQLRYESRTLTRFWEGKASEAGHRIEILGRKFLRASVYYHPENEDGFVAEVHCHCRRNSRSTCCKNEEDRPRILVSVKKEAPVIA